MRDDRKIRRSHARVRAQLESLRDNPDSQVCTGELVLQLPRRTAARLEAALAEARHQLLAAVRAAPPAATEPVAVTIARERLDRSEDIPDWLALALLLERHADRLATSAGPRALSERED